MQTQKIKNDFGYLLGIAFVFFFVLWIVELILLFSPKIYDQYRSHQELKETFASLSKFEKKVLAYFLLEECQTRDCRPDWQEVQSLVRKDILVNLGDDGFYSHEPHSIKTKAWVYLKKNKTKFLEEAIKANPELKERQDSTNA